MSFHSFLGTRGHSITFSINTMDTLWFIFCSQDYLNWLTTDILQLLSVMQILTVGDSKGHYFQRIHTFHLSESVWGADWLQGYNLPRDKVTFYQVHLQLWIWVSADRSFAPCVHMWFKMPVLPYELFSLFLHFPPCLPVSVSLSLPVAHTPAYKHCIRRRKV